MSTEALALYEQRTRTMRNNVYAMPLRMAENLNPTASTLNPGRLPQAVANNAQITIMDYDTWPIVVMSNSSPIMIMELYLVPQNYI